MIITIDGPASSGKSTAAEIVATKLKYRHLNSGAIFRGITAYLLKHGFDFSKVKTQKNFDIHIKLRYLKGIQNVYINDENMTPYLRDNEVSQLTAIVATNASIRKIIDDFQHEFASKNDIVVDGRDTGSYVYPNADYKFYLDSSISVRAKRRYLEEKQKGSKITLKDIKEQIALRDEMDKNRKIAPLVIPKNAIIIDSTHLNIEETADAIMSFIR